MKKTNLFVVFINIQNGKRGAFWLKRGGFWKKHGAFFP